MCVALLPPPLAAHSFTVTAPPSTLVASETSALLRKLGLGLPECSLQRPSPSHDDWHTGPLTYFSFFHLTPSLPELSSLLFSSLQIARIHMAEMATVTVFGPALELMKSVKSPEGEMLTKPFLDVCRNVLPVIGMYGPGGFTYANLILPLLSSISRSLIPVKNPMGACFVFSSFAIFLQSVVVMMWL